MTSRKRHRILTAAMLIGSIAAIILSSFASFAKDCDEVKAEVIRLHILANSDSKEDQNLKYLLRDELIMEMRSIFGNYESRDEAVQSAEQNLKKIEKLAKIFIINQGYNYDVQVSLENMYFTTRIYENLTMPAGFYTALRVEIGEGIGQNWWCVIFPPLCLPAASKNTAEPYFSPEASEMIENGGKIEIKFKTYEWLSGLFK